MAKSRLTEDEIRFIFSLNTSQAQQEYRKIEQANKELAEANRERLKEMRRLEAANQKESEQYKNLAKAYKDARDQVGKNNETLKQLTSQIGINNMTMAQLKSRAKELQAQLDKTSRSTHPEEWNKLRDKLVETKQRMNELRVAGRDTEKSLGDMILSHGRVASFWGNVYTKAAEIVVQKIKQAIAFVKEGMNMGAVAQGIERAFNRLDSPGLLKNLRSATKGLVNDMELMKAAVKANNFRIPLDELGTLLRFAQQRAQETGESVDYLTNSIVTGIGRKSPLILDNLGISASKLNEEVARTGDFAAAVGKIVREELAKSGESVDTVADKSQRKAAMLQNIQLSIGRRLIGVTDAIASGWTSVLSVIDKWLQLPVDKRLRDEQRETNILARSIMMAGENTEVRTLLIKEMQRQYPDFLRNLDTENLSNEQLADRLRDVNAEYGKRIRVQVLNDKVLSPLQEKQKKLIEEQMDGIMKLNELAEKYPDRLSSGFIQAIRSGEVLKMSTKEIRKELSVLSHDQNKALSSIEGNVGNAASGLAELASGDSLIKIEKTIGRLKSIPSELENVNKEIADTTGRIAAFSGPDNKKQAPGADTEVKGLLEQYEEKRKALLDERLKATSEAAIKEKNIEIAALDAKIEALTKSEKAQTSITEQATSQRNESILDSMRRYDNEKLSLIRNTYARELDLLSETTEREKLEIEKQYADGEVTREQHDAMLLSLEAESAKGRLDIERQYASDVNNMEFSIGVDKAEAVREAGNRVLKAEFDIVKARAELRKKLETMVSDFKKEFRLTTVGEDIEAQNKALEAAYQARLEMARKEGVDTTELTAAYEKAKNQIVEQAEGKRNQIREKYGLLTLKEKQKQEREELRRAYESGLLSYKEYLDAMKLLAVKHQKEHFDYYKNIISGAVNALQEAEIANIDAKYDAEIARAKGNAEEVERLEKEKERKKLDVQKKYANVQFAIRVSEIIANTAVAVMKALSDLGPIAGHIAAGLITVTGLAQIATANAERRKIMSLTVDGSGGSASGGARVASGREAGGYVDVIREQDGKPFNALFDPDKRGYVDRPTVIVGEGPAGRSREWVASNDALQNPTVAPFIDVMNEAQERGEIRTVDMNLLMRRRLAGFESGGFVSPDENRRKEPGKPAATASAYNPKSAEAIERLNRLLDKLERDGIDARLVYSEFQKQKNKLDESRKIGSKV